MKNDELLHKWVNGELTAAEEAKFRQRPEYASLERLRQQMERMQAPDLRGEEMLEAILQTPKSEARRRVLGRGAWWYAAAAVGLLLAVWVFLLAPPKTQVLATTAGQRLDEHLPDESSFVLGPDSEIRYEPGQWTERRALSLTGEAYFEVQEGSTFTVATPQGEVEVLGTQFNVWSRNNQLEVSCYSGRVAVRFAATAFDTVLVAGQAIRLAADAEPLRWAVRPEQVANHLMASSVTRIQQAPLSRVIRELERQYGIQVKTNTVDTSRVLSTGFPNGNLEQALELVFRPLGIRYELVSGQQINLFQEEE